MRGVMGTGLTEELYHTLESLQRSATFFMTFHTIYEECYTHLNLPLLKVHGKHLCVSFFMAIAAASISTYVYKYVIHRIAIPCVASGAISAQIGEKSHRLLGRYILYLYLYCIYIVLLYLPSTCANKMCVRFTTLFHLKQ